MDAAVICCGSCGGPLAPDDIKCPSCGSQVATVACPNCMGMVSVHALHCEHCGAAIGSRESSPTDLACPACKTSKLAQSPVGKVAVDQCLRCGGVWMSQTFFDQISADKETRGMALGVLPLGEAPKEGEAPTTAGDIQVVYRPCPCCSAMMNRYNYARISGIILDGCKNHGLWFDRDELRRVLDFIQGGGLEKSRTREISRLEEEQRSKVLMTQMAGAVHPTSSAYDYQFGGHQIGAGILGSLVDGLVDFFIL